MPHALNSLVLAASVAELVGALFVAGLLLAFHRILPRDHLSCWAWSWLAGAMRLACSLASAMLPPPPRAAHAGLLAAYLASEYLHTAWLVLGARGFLGHAAAPARLRRGLLGGAVALGLGSALLAWLPLPSGLAFGLRRFLPSALALAVLLTVGVAALRLRLPAPAFGPRLVGIALLAYGGERLHTLALGVVWLVAERLPAYAVYSGFLDFLAFGVFGLGAVVALLEDEHRAGSRARLEAQRRAEELQAERDRLRESEEAHRYAEERWRRLSEATFEGIGFSQDGRVIDANPQLAAMLGYAPEELVGRRVTDLVAPESLSLVRERLASHAGEAYEHLAVRRDGSTLHVETRARTLVHQGRVVRMTAIRDVSDRARLEAELRRAERLAAVGSLVAGVAHEVRTPLFSISATLDAFEAELSRGPAEAESLALLRSQVARLTRLMSDLLDYGRPSALRPTAGGVADIVRQALRACRPAAQGAGVALVADVAADLPLVDRDPARLEQVFQNLLANAVQHSPRGSTVRISARAVTSPRPGLECLVEDQGTGLAQEDLVRVFEPFFSRRKGGTGLGLSIVQRVVEGHGGTVLAGNRPGAGALFTVFLPAATPPAAAPGGAR